MCWLGSPPCPFGGDGGKPMAAGDNNIIEKNRENVLTRKRRQSEYKDNVQTFSRETTQ